MVKTLNGLDSHSQIDGKQLPQIAGLTPIVRSLVAGDMLFRSGDPAFAVFRLVTGQVRLVLVTPDGTEVPMHTVRSGELFAEAALFSPRYHCDAVATKDSEVLQYSKEKLMRELKADEYAMWEFAAEMAHRVQGLRTRLEIRQIRSAPERVLQALRLRCDSVGHWKLDGTLKQFAQEIGLTHEALYRALATLARNGRITKDADKITLVESKSKAAFQKRKTR